MAPRRSTVIFASGLSGISTIRTCLDGGSTTSVLSSARATEVVRSDKPAGGAKGGQCLEHIPPFGSDFDIHSDLSCCAISLSPTASDTERPTAINATRHNLNSDDSLLPNDQSSRPVPIRLTGMHVRRPRDRLRGPRLISGYTPSFRFNESCELRKAASWSASLPMAEFSIRGATRFWALRQ